MRRLRRHVLTGRPSVWLVSPAWRRYPVTRLVLSQWRWLCDELAARGLDANAVIVANDENLDIAREHGFDTVDVDNTGLGRRFNAGFRHAADQGADYFVHVGSDDWIHPDVFDILATDRLAGEEMPDPTPDNPVVWRPGPRVLTHSRIALVDLEDGTLSLCETKGRYGVIPWIIPRGLLEKTGFAPVNPWLMRGIDGDLMRRIGTPPLIHGDTPEIPSVDFKTAVNVTPFDQVADTLGTDVAGSAWETLRSHYPADLVDMAERTQLEIAAAKKPLAKRTKRTASVWFVVPAFGRAEQTRVCLRQLARTCDTLTENRIAASAVVIADDDNLDAAADLGFAVVRRENSSLGAKWNDGYQLACDPNVNRWPADYAIPLGSDDWVDPALIVEGGLPSAGAVGCYQLAAFVSEDGCRMARIRIPYEGGIGIRMIPAALLAQVGYRPAEEDRARAIDASVFTGLGYPRCEYLDVHPLQIIDWKSEGQQLNSYADCLRYLDGDESDDPWADLARTYPAAALEEMRAVYLAREPVAA